MIDEDNNPVLVNAISLHFQSAGKHRNLTAPMFRVTLKISQENGHTSLNRKRRHKCRLLLVTISLFSVAGLFMLSSYGPESFLLNTGFNETTNRTHISNRTSRIVERTESSNSSLKARVTNNYCSIKDCKTIYCSLIPEELDPGDVASRFIKSNLKIDCGMIKSIVLVFDNCKFPSNTIRRNWLNVDLIIEDLTLSSCFLIDIHDDAFQPVHFSEMNGLTIISNAIRSLRKAVFKNLPMLKRLTIRDNIVEHVDYDLMANQSYTLENLELEGVLKSAGALERITGATTLKELQILSLRRNFLSEIGANVFLGVSKVKSLYLDTSEIKNVHPKAFDPMSKSIIMLTMSNNIFTSLPEGVFDSIVNRNPIFRVSIENNPFHCDCSLKWLQDFIRMYPLIVRVMPQCESPKINQGLSFSRAHFCQDNSSSIVTTSTESTSTSTQTTLYTEPTTIGKTLRVSCSIFPSGVMESINSRRLLWSVDLDLAKRHPGFSAVETERGGVLVKIPNATNDLTLIWFESNNPENSLSCAKNLRGSHILRNTRHDTAYTICLLQEDDDTVSPLNCIAVNTNLDYDSDVWLTNADKSTVFYSTVGCLFTLCPCIAALTYFIVRRYPSLLKGSKRVMMVRRRTVDAIVLPKGVTMQPNDRIKIDREFSVSSTQEDGYVIPLPPAPLPPRRFGEYSTRMDSRVSDSSSQSNGHTYVSGVEPTLPQMVSWKLRRLKSGIEENKPPLPPREVPSISSAVRSKENIYSDHLFYNRLEREVEATMNQCGETDPRCQPL